MNNIKVKEIMRALDCDLTSIEKLLNRTDLNPSCYITIGLQELPEKIIKDKPFDLVDKSNEELRLLAYNIEQVLQARTNEEAIERLKSDMSFIAAQLRELGVEPIIKY